jgi:hypothetical protein
MIEPEPVTIALPPGMLVISTTGQHDSYGPSSHTT